MPCFCSGCFSRPPPLSLCFDLWVFPSELAWIWLMDLPLASLRCVAFLRAYSPFLVVALVGGCCRGLAGWIVVRALLALRTWHLLLCVVLLFEGLQPIFGFDLPPRQLGVMTKPTANCSIEPSFFVVWLLDSSVWNGSQHPLQFADLRP